MFKGYLVGFLHMQTSAVPEPMAVLHRIRSVVGRIDTPGLSDEEIVSFLDADPFLQMAIEEAAHRHEHMAQAQIATCMCQSRSAGAIWRPRDLLRRRGG